jgi:hypothetical protein
MWCNRFSKILCRDTYLCRDEPQMARTIRPAAVLPPGLFLEQVVMESDATVITVRVAGVEACCPSCTEPAHRVHSRYVRTLLDLPMGGRSVRLRVVARRFRCDAPACARRIFAERLGPVAPWARRTARLDTLAHHLALALGGRPAAQFASRLMLPSSTCSRPAWLGCPRDRHQICVRANLGRRSGGQL